jgi:hypothetical protein
MLVVHIHHTTMNPTLRHLLRCFVFVSASRLATAQTPAPMTVSAAWLKEHVNDPSLVLLFTSGQPDQPRIPGARYIGGSALADGARRGALELPPAAQLDSALEALGVSDRSRIVVYAGDPRGMTNAARLYLTRLGRARRSHVHARRRASGVARRRR